MPVRTSSLVSSHLSLATENVHNMSSCATLETCRRPIEECALDMPTPGSLLLMAAQGLGTATDFSELFTQRIDGARAARIKASSPSSVPRTSPPRVRTDHTGTNRGECPGDVQIRVRCIRIIRSELRCVNARTSSANSFTRSSSRRCNRRRRERGCLST